MTAITSAQSRNVLDAYYTPAWMSRELFKQHPIKGTVFECCAGDGAIARIAREHGCTVYTGDIDSSLDVDFVYDAASPECPISDCDWWITNPPFGCADSIVFNAYEQAQAGIAMLLRCTWLESVLTGDRANWLAAHPPTQIISVPRFAFSRSKKTGKYQTDSAPCWWVIWRKDGLKSANPFVSVPWHQIEGFHRKPH